MVKRKRIVTAKWLNSVAGKRIRLDGRMSVHKLRKHSRYTTAITKSKDTKKRYCQFHRFAKQDSYVEASSDEDEGPLATPSATPAKKDPKRKLAITYCEHCCTYLCLACITPFHTLSDKFE